MEKQRQNMKLVWIHYHFVPLEVIEFAVFQTTNRRRVISQRYKMTQHTQNIMDRHNAHSTLKMMNICRRILTHLSMRTACRCGGIWNSSWLPSLPGLCSKRSHIWNVLYWSMVSLSRTSALASHSSITPPSILTFTASFTVGWWDLQDRWSSNDIC